MQSQTIEYTHGTTVIAVLSADGQSKDMTQQQAVGRPQLLSVVTIMIAIGVVWTAVVLYRLYTKDISGEWGNIVLASVGLGGGLATLYGATLTKRNVVALVGLGLATSIAVLVALAFWSGAL